MLRIALCALLAGFAAAPSYAQSMSSGQVIEFIKSELKLKLDSDGKIAAYVKKLKLTDRLEDRQVEELQGMGAGPRTIAALRALSSASASLPAAPTPALMVAPPVIPPPSSEEQAAILKEIVENARNYAKTLPDYMCVEVTRRHFDPTGNENWRTYDTVQEEVSYVDHKESYKVMMVNNVAVSNVKHENLGGSTLSGDFGTFFTEIFAEKTATEFQWDHWATLRGRRMYVFAFHVPQSRSHFTIATSESPRVITAGYRGLIYADRDTKKVMRYKFDCEDIPADFPVKQVSVDVNYDFVEIAGQKYVLPLKTEMRSREGRLMTWNEAEFHLYRKFGAETNIIFTPSDIIPPDQTQEQPAIPDDKDKVKKRP